MTAIQRVARTRRLLAAGVLLSATAWAAAVLLGSFAIIGFATSLSQSSRPLVDAGLWIAILLGVFTVAFLLWRGRHIAATDRVALWIEERLPRLQYSLITAIDPAPMPDKDALESAVEREDISGITRSAFGRSVGPAVGALILAAALLYVSPSAAFGRSGLFARAGGRGPSGAIPAESRLTGLRVDVFPPAYARKGSTSLDDPESVRALIGSRIVVTGTGAKDGIQAHLGDLSHSVGGSTSSWSTQLVMPAKPAALTLTDRSYGRVIVLEPQIDEVPKVVLLSPVRDTTFRKPQPLMVRLHAEGTDDVALTTGYFEYLITSGSGEIFTGRTITTPPVDFGGARAGSLDATLDLASLKLAQGDVVSIRALVRDANTLSGPSIGTSDTRTYRIARADEYDSVSIEAAAPPPVDSSAMSQRMLILMTEALVKKEKTLSREEWVKQSTEIGTMEDRIRKRVYDILYETDSPAGAGDTEEAESEVHAITNKDLKEAYDALWVAVRSLQIAEPKPALPPMRVALQALDRARLAQRLYLRGRPPKIIVDVQRVRLTGKDKGAGSIRTPRPFADSVRLHLSSQFNSVLDLLEKEPARAMRELALMRVDALSTVPDFAAALSEAADAMRAGRDATLPLMRARRALDGAARAVPGLPQWSGG